MCNFDRNDIKMSVVDTNYFFNGNNVTAEVTVRVNAPEMFHYLFGEINAKVVAVAKCHPDDGYDKEIGMRVARAKAEGRAYRLVKNEVIRRWNEVLDGIESLAPLKANFVEKADNCDEHNKEYVKRITNNTF